MKRNYNTKCDFTIFPIQAVISEHVKKQVLHIDLKKLFDLRWRLATLHTVAGRVGLLSKTFLSDGHALARFGGGWVVDPPLGVKL